MKKKIILVGKNSFIGSNIYKNLNKKFQFKIYNFDNFINESNFILSKFDYIINCAINKDYVYRSYLEKNDFDYQICKKINNLTCKQVMISTRKVYKNKDNIKENDPKSKKNFYEKNKIITENKIKKLIPKKFLILRISNLIGVQINKNNKRKIHKTFIDIFFQMVRKGVIYDNKNLYKDFISINKLAEILSDLFHKNISGTYNVSIGRRVYLKDVVSWLNRYNNSKLKKIQLPKYSNSDCFYLNNTKLMNKINVVNNINCLKKDCFAISRKFFFRKK